MNRIKQWSNIMYSMIDDLVKNEDSFYLMVDVDDEHFDVELPQHLLQQPSQLFLIKDDAMRDVEIRENGINFYFVFDLPDGGSSTHNYFVSKDSNTVKAIVSEQDDQPDALIYCMPKFYEEWISKKAINHVDMFRNNPMNKKFFS